jgi:hypothetical protein
MTVVGVEFAADLVAIVGGSAVKVLVFGKT